MYNSKNNLQLLLDGRGVLHIHPSDFVTSGGEGAIYRAGDTIIKLYSDKDKMRRDRMVDKINLLSRLRHPYIVAPEGIVSERNGNPLGYYMKYEKGEAFPRVFTNDFRRRESFGDRDAMFLVTRMREMIQYVHSQKAVMVDANEMNYLMKRVGVKVEPRVLDVDSWMIGQWPAKVIMPSIRDYHSASFGRDSDWFAWAIVSFQIFCGIHPYKGNLPGYNMSDLEKRMKDKASVFRKGIKLNKAVRDFSCIPSSLLDWYYEVFENAYRSEPPSPFDTHKKKRSLKQLAIHKSEVHGNLVFEKLFAQSGKNVIKVFPCGLMLLDTLEIVEIASQRVIYQAKSLDCELVQKDKGYLIAEQEAGKWSFSFINSLSRQIQNLNFNLDSRKLLRFENRLFYTSEQGLTELISVNLGMTILSVGATWRVVNQSAKWYDGLGVENIMGAKFLIIPFGEKSCAQVRVKELDGLRVVTAKAGEGFAVLVAMDKNGLYKKLEFSFEKDYSSYRLWQANTDQAELNMVILSRGVCATIVEDGILDVFVPKTGDLKRVQDSRINSEMYLAKWGERVLYIEKGLLASVRMK